MDIAAAAAAIDDDDDDDAVVWPVAAVVARAEGSMSTR